MTVRTWDILTAGGVALLISIVVTLGRDIVFGTGASIIISDLSFEVDPLEGPAIRQVRTVRGARPVAAIWTASLRRADTDAVICSGQGHFRYPPGLRSPVLPIDRWVGEEGCWDKVPLGAPLQACAEYEVADNEPVTACSTIFTRHD